MKTKLPPLPELLSRKIYKTGQTRGADDDVIFQNRVGRNSTVLIPYSLWKTDFEYPENEKNFENGFIVLIPPATYFAFKNPEEDLQRSGLQIGLNALVCYETREQWEKFNPLKLKWKPAVQRKPPLKGQFVARISATTATQKGGKIVHGFNTTSNKGAGIRFFEYSSTETIKQCRDQLEALFWLCHDSEAIASKNGMSINDAALRKAAILKLCSEQGFLDYERLIQSRALNKKQRTVCPLCLDEISGAGFFARMKQAEGREVHDITVTEINLFHIEELRCGLYCHRPYNLAWGHHHCNVVTKDSGIIDTLLWMRVVLKRNFDGGYKLDETSVC